MAAVSVVVKPWNTFSQDKRPLGRGLSPGLPEQVRCTNFVRSKDLRTKHKHGVRIEAIHMCIENVLKSNVADNSINDRNRKALGVRRRDFHVTSPVRHMVLRLANLVAVLFLESYHRDEMFRFLQSERLLWRFQFHSNKRSKLSNPPHLLNWSNNIVTQHRHKLLLFHSCRKSIKIFHRCRWGGRSKTSRTASLIVVRNKLHIL